MTDGRQGDLRTPTPVIGENDIPARDPSARRGFLGKPFLRLPVSMRIVAIVLVGILIPSVLITFLGLLAVYRAEPMVREQLALPLERLLEKLHDQVSREWEYRRAELGLRAAAAHGGGGFASLEPAQAADAIVLRGGTFQRLQMEAAPVVIEAAVEDLDLALARRFELRERDHRRALDAYRGALREALHEDSPEVAIEALLGAARCQHALGDFRESVRSLRAVVDRAGGLADLTGADRSLPALLRIAEISRESGDPSGEQLAVRELAAALEERWGGLDADQRVFYLDRLKRYPEVQGSLGRREKSAPAPQEPAPDDLLDRVRAQVREAAPPAEPSDVRVRLGDGGFAVFSVFPIEEGGAVYLRIDPAEYLRDVILLGRALGIPERTLRFVDSEGKTVRPAGEEPAPAAQKVGPLVARALPRPFEFLNVECFPAPGQVTEDLRSLETSRVALFTWSIIVLVLLIILGVSLTLRSVLREMRVTRLKSDFVSFITHELKTPLTAIRMFTETLLLDRVTDGEDRRRCVEVIDREAARLTRLIDQVLEFSKIERRQRPYQFASADMVDVVHEAVRIFLELNRESGCEVEVITAQESISKIKMDRAAMVELLLNLLSNALKYSRESRKIVVNVRESINEIAVDVVDRGIGIPKREQRRIFEQFYRAEDYLTRAVEGTGLGLTFARYIAKVHGGDIKVTSSVNQGSTFTLELRKNQILAE